MGWRKMDHIEKTGCVMMTRGYDGLLEYMFGEEDRSIIGIGFSSGNHRKGQSHSNGIFSGGQKGMIHWHWVSPELTRRDERICITRNSEGSS